MLNTRIFGLICAVLALIAMFELIRRQNVKEKYTVLWFMTAIAIVVVALDPGILDLFADLTGIKSGPNVLLLVGGLVVVIVCVHLSVEVSRLEDRTRALAEEIGLLRLELHKHKADGQVDA